MGNISGGKRKGSYWLAACKGKVYIKGVKIMSFYYHYNNIVPPIIVNKKT